MNVKKTIIISISALALLVPSFGSSAVQAATWHKGVPNTIKGFWMTNFIKSNYGYTKHQMYITNELGVDPSSTFYKFNKHKSGLGGKSGQDWNSHYKYVSKDEVKIASGDKPYTNVLVKIHGHNNISFKYEDNKGGYTNFHRVSEKAYNNAVS